MMTNSNQKKVNIHETVKVRTTPKGGHKLQKLPTKKQIENMKNKENQDRIIESTDRVDFVHPHSSKPNRLLT